MIQPYRITGFHLSEYDFKFLGIHMTHFLASLYVANYTLLLNQIKAEFERFPHCDVMNTITLNGHTSKVSLFVSVLPVFTVYWLTHTVTNLHYLEKRFTYSFKKKTKKKTLQTFIHSYCSQTNFSLTKVMFTVMPEIIEFEMAK